MHSGRWGIATRIEKPDLTRWILIATPFGSVLVTRLRLPDTYEHRHASSFVSLILRGGYIEQRDSGDLDRPTPAKPRVFGDLNLVRRHEHHRIVALLNGPVWTIAVTGRNHEGTP